MEVVGSEIGHKMRSAIKAKLTELGCYVDDELPDYVMVMVANKRTRTQMEDDLQLFLVDNTKLFVNWLHQVLKKLQEVTVTAPIKLPETESSKETIRLKDHKSKDRKSKEKLKKTETKKAKKKDKAKDKQHRKKEDKKGHKSKKKSKHHEMIHPNVPPLLMNMEKVSEPSITDVFAGQILKSHGFSLDELKDDPKIIEEKPVIAEAKRPIKPIIDPASIPSQSEPLAVKETKSTSENIEKGNVTSHETTKEEQINEMNAIEAKIQGLKQKLTEQLDSMSDDEDFLNIRTEADELMNDFAEDVFQEIAQPVIATPPILPKSPPVPPPCPITPVHTPDIIPKESVEMLPQIELKLPKRPLRERYEEHKADGCQDSGKTDKSRTKSPERFTPERAPTIQPQVKSVKSRLGNTREKKVSASDDKVPNKSESTSKRLNSRVSVLEGRPSRATCASVVRVRPRPRVQAPSSSLLMKAMADAHKSLLNIPPKMDPDSQVKRALVLPIRRTVDTQKIVIQVPVTDNSQTDDIDTDRQGEDAISLGEMDSDDDKIFRETNEYEKEEYVPTSITKKITNNEYIPSRRNEGRKASRKNDTLIIETINIHNPTVDKDKSTQFIVTMDGYHPNAFLAKKLLNEGIINTEEELDTPKPADNKDKETTREKVPDKTDLTSTAPNNVSTKISSNTSDENSCTQVIIKTETELDSPKNCDITEPIEKVEEEKSPSVRKRKASPIVFDIVKREKESGRVKTDSVSSDSCLTVATTPNTHKYDSVPPLSQPERKQAVWCRAFPLCRYGSACAFMHPRCKFAAACTRRDCVYSHGPMHAGVPPVILHTPALASHVVPVANYKSISTVPVPGMCKYYPSCVNPACHYYHPKPCRYGKNCTNKLECNFYHIDVPGKWKSPY